MEHLEMLFNAGIPAVDVYADAMGISTKEVTKSMEKGELATDDFINTLNRAFAEGTSNFPALAGAAKKAGASWSGTFDNMRAAVTRGVQSILTAIDDTLRALKNTDMREIISKFGKSFESALNTVAKAIPPIIKAIDLLSPAIVGVVVGVEAYTIAVKLAAAAQAVWNAVTAATLSPIALVIAGVAAAATGVVLLSDKLAEGGEELNYWNERNAEAVAATEEMRQKTDALRETREKSLGTDLAQIDNTERLAQELYSLVDANGFVQDANRARVDFILGELNSAYGTEFQMIDGIVQEYDKMQGSLTEVIAAKRASIMLDAWGEEYKNAINSIGKMRDVVSEHRTNLDTMQADMADLAEKYPQAWEKLSQAQRIFGDDQAAIALELEHVDSGVVFKRKYDALQEAVENERQLYETSVTDLQNCYTAIDTVERAGAEMQRKNYLGVEEILNSASLARTREAEDVTLSEDQKTQALAQAYANRLAAYAQYAEELKSGMAGHSASELEMIRADAIAAQEAYKATGQAKVDGQIQGIDGKTLDLQASFDRLAAVGITSLQSSLPLYTQVGAEISQSAASGVQSSTALTDASVQMMANTKLAADGALAGSGFTDSGAQIAQQTADGIQTSAALSGSAAQMVADVKSATDTAIVEGDFTASGDQIASQTAGGVQSSTALSAAAKTSVSGAKNAADAQVAACNFSSVGARIVNDIAQGVAKGVGAITAAVRSAISAAMAEANAASGATSGGQAGGGQSPRMASAPQSRQRSVPLDISPESATNYSSLPAIRTMQSAMDSIVDLSGAKFAGLSLPVQSFQMGVLSGRGQLALETSTASHQRATSSAAPTSSTPTKIINLGGVKLYAAPGASESEMTRVLGDYVASFKWRLP